MIRRFDKLQLNIGGLIIFSGWMDPFHQYRGQIDFIRENQLIKDPNNKVGVITCFVELLLILSFRILLIVRQRCVKPR